MIDYCLEVSKITPWVLGNDAKSLKSDLKILINSIDKAFPSFY